MLDVPDKRSPRLETAGSEDWQNAKAAFNRASRRPDFT